uniref:Uncharacterized protein n=1 Tax=Solanum lycopersicum TaxID=4081 RepID=A0A3Q7HRC9_SOLLC
MIGGIRFPVQIRSDLTNRERKKEANSIFFSLFDVIQHHSGLFSFLPLILFFKI